MRDAVRREITLDTAEKSYRLNDEIATLIVRPRGWHLPERHLDGRRRAGVGEPVRLRARRSSTTRASCSSAAAGRTSTCRSSSRISRRGCGRRRSRSRRTSSGCRRGSIRCTVLIETILAAFEMEEILYELRDYGCALNAGRWDYIFSCIKKFRTRDWVLPDRAQVTMAVPFMRAYTELLVRTCHRRGAHAIGGMAAFIPSRKDPEVNRVALAKVREDKERESRAGFDGTWVAHPDLVPVATEIFDAVLGERPNQVERLREDVVPDEAALLSIPDTPGEITEQGLRTNVSVGIRYLDAWLHGVGAAAIDNLMEDAATAEISRSQVWQWVRAGRFDAAQVRRGGGGGRGRRRGEGALPRARARAGARRVPHAPAYNFWSEPRQHQGRRHRARDRGGDRLRGARARDRPPPGAAVRAVQRLADAGARGVAAPGRARPRLVRAEPRRARAHDLARGAARGVHGARRARVARDGGRRAEGHAGGSRGARCRREALRRDLARAAVARARRGAALDHGRLGAREPRVPRRHLPRRRPAARRAAREERAPLVLGAGGVGAGRPLARRPLREERRAAPRDQAGARGGSAAGARALAREHVLSSFVLLETILEQVGAQPRDWQRGRAARR